VDPLKLLEYLAAGLPVVSTAIPEAAKYSGTVSVAADTDAFLGAVRAALQGDHEASRVRGQALARENTWEDRAETFLELVRGVIDARELAGAGGPIPGTVGAAGERVG
jgi:glycosyltransferase involved in cell wall biosynthesis